MEKTRITPKRAAQLIIYRWITCGGTSPWWMDCDEMTLLTEDYGYKVTEKRREEIIRHVDAMTEPLRLRCVNNLGKAGIDV
ncbi:MAG: hypothetical protein ACQEXV_24020 [Bacillota bacterium]